MKDNLDTGVETRASFTERMEEKAHQFIHHHEGRCCHMRFFYHNEGNPRMDYLNSTLRQPLLFAPANAVKAMTLAYFYSAGPKPLAQMLCRGTPNHLSELPTSLVT